MKKVLMLVLAFFIILPAVEVSAAYVYVPNFYNITSNKIEERIRFIGMDQKNYQGVNYTSWKYQCVDGKGNIYIEKYIKRIASKPTFKFIGQDSNGWYFVYTGAQAKYLKMLAGSFHIQVSKIGNNVFVNMVAGMYPD